jgi:uncharacterized membrane-anchored protein
MKKHTWGIILLNLLLLVGYINWAIIGKENLLAEGDLILLKLAPVDPRSLMQGDYMNLRYEFVSNLKADSIPKRGFCVVTLDETKVASLVRLQAGKAPLNQGEYLINYTTNSWQINIGAESFFFQEGQAAKYENAKYGAVKVDNAGNNVLFGLFDENKKQIQ